MKKNVFAFILLTVVAISASAEVSTKWAYAEKYNSTHTCDLSQFDTKVFESTQLKCTPSSSANAPERAIISLQNSQMEWTFYRNGSESFSDTNRVEYVGPRSRDNSGLCSVRTLYSDFSCNVNECRTIIYFGVNNKTQKVEMYYQRIRCFIAAAE